MIAHVLLLMAPVALTGACGGGAKKATTEPVVDEDAEPPPREVTEEDRARDRLAAAHDIVPAGSTCLPAALKEPDAPRLELAAIGNDAVVCAIDTDEDELLGPVGCWKVDLGSGQLAYHGTSPLPGRGFSIKLDDRCARGYCLPDDAEVPASKIAHVVWSADGANVAVLVGETVHVFNAASKAHERSFSIRGEKGMPGEPVAIHWAGEAIFLQGDGDASGVWAFKQDGTPVGPLAAIGSKDGMPLPLLGGSFSLLDKERVAIAEQGFSTMTTFEANTGKRTKLVRKLTKPPCKTPELEAFWRQTDGVGPKCKAHMEKSFGHLIGATAVAGSKNFLVLLRGKRLGDLAVLDGKSLAEKKLIQLPWCKDAAAREGGAKGGGGKADGEAGDE